MTQPSGETLIAADIGGTNARFCLAHIAPGGAITLGPPKTLPTRDHASFGDCWRAFTATLPGPSPRAAAIAIACPVGAEILRLTNSPWVIRPANLGEELGLDHLTIVNDFGAIGHAVSHLTPADLRHLAGPQIPPPAQGSTSIIGPGTGLGVAQLLRRNGHTHVIETEGGHGDFAPLDPLEDAILAQLRQRFGRVSNERIASGPGLGNLYQALAAIEGKTATPYDDATIWDAAINQTDPLAATALQRFCLSLGAIAGDIALAQGANSVLIAGGIIPRIAHMLPNTGFATRFAAKGRFSHYMAAIPIHLITHPQPGLLGAAAVYAAGKAGGL